MENKIAKELIESFGYEHQLDELSASDAWDATKAVAGSDFAKTAAAGAVAGKVASKALGRAIPGVGTALSWKDAYDRWQEGDRSGSVMSALAGAAYLFPGLGTAIGIGLDAANIGSDLAKDDDEETAAKPETPVNKLAQLQQIIGAKPDGIYGPETKEKLMAWQKEQGIKVDGIPGSETYTTAGLAESKGIIMKKTTVAEDIAALRDKLSIIENEELVNEAGAVDLTKAIWNIVKTGVYNTDDIIKTLTKQFGNLPGNIRQQVDYAIKTVGKKIPSVPGNKGLATAEPGELSKVGAKSGEYIPKGQKTGELTAKAGNVIDVERSAMSNPKLSTVDKQGIKNLGIVKWLKANPKKAAIIAGAAGLLAGYGLSGSDTKVSGLPASGQGGKKGDPEIMDRQRILNDLGANIKVDGIWGPETEKAYQEYWVKNFAKHNALATGASPEEAEKRQANWDAASQMGGQSTSSTTTTPNTELGKVPGEAPIDPAKYSDAYKELTKNMDTAPVKEQPSDWPDINAENRNWRPTPADVERARAKMGELLQRGSLSNADYEEIQRELERNRPAYIPPPLSQQLSDLKAAEKGKSVQEDSLNRIKALVSYTNK